MSILKKSFLFLSLVIALLLGGCQQVQQTTTVPEANIVLKGSINKVKDSLGHVNFYGEVENRGGKSASFIKVTITMKNASGAVIDTDSSYIYGTVLMLSRTGIETNTCLKPGECGAFRIITTTNYSDVASYTYDIGWESDETSNPSASFEVVGSVNESFDFWGKRKYLGEIKNNSSTNATFVEIIFVSKDSSGNVIDISSSYVTGTNVNAGETKSFEVSTSVLSTEVASYYYKFDWDE